MRDQAKQLRLLMAKKMQKNTIVKEDGSVQVVETQAKLNTQQVYENLLKQSHEVMGETVTISDVMIPETEVTMIPEIEVAEANIQTVETVEETIVPTSVVTSEVDEFQSLKLELNEETAKDIKIYAICSGKGGVGKTNFTVNLAINMQRSGKKVLIIDTDYGFTNIDVLCGLVTPYSLQDVFKGERTLSEVIVEGPEGVKFIPGGNDIVGLGDMAQDHKRLFQTQFLELNDIDVILIDMGAGVSKLSMLYTMFAQELILVTTPEPTSLTDAYSLLKLIDQYQLKDSVKVVVNRATTHEEAKRTYESLKMTVEKHLGLNLQTIGEIKDDPCVPASVKAQVPFVLKYANSQPAKDVQTIANALLDINNQKVKFKSIQQVFGRLMRVFD